MKIVGKYLLRIVFFLSIISTLLFYQLENLKSFYLTNQTLNSLIIFVISIGIIYISKQLFNIKNELLWLNNALKSSSSSKLSSKSPMLLKYLDTYLKEHSGRFIFSQTSMKTVMESLEGRLIETREISRYMIGLSIFLGLLGTFWGLLETINSVGVTVVSVDTVLFHPLIVYFQ